MEESPNRFGLLILIIVIVLVVGTGLYFLVKGKQKFISPVPAEPSFKVIYYTPTPAAVTPSATPSATPKVKAAPTKALPTPTVESTPTVTPKSTATPTP